MTVTVNVRMKQRRKTAANWTSANEVLLDGEMGLETDTRKFKFGDGVTAWNSLAYAATAPVTSVAGKTGVVTLVKADVGLGSVDNTADTAKPVSTAQQTALNLKANLASPTFSGNVTAPTTLLTNIKDSANAFRAILNAGGATTLYSPTSYQFANASGGTVYATINSTGLDVLGEVRGDSLRVDVAPVAAAVAQTHHIPININGTTYKLLLAS